MDFFEALYDRFHEIHTDLVRAVEGLPPEALDWTPGAEMNSINVLVVHLSGAERYWIGLASNDPPDRIRDKEFRAHGLSAEELQAHLLSADDFVRQMLTRFSLPELEAVRNSAHSDRSFTAGWCILHALEHSALHLGQVQLTRQLWEQKSQ